MSNNAVCIKCGVAYPAIGLFGFNVCPLCRQRESSQSESAKNRALTEESARAQSRILEKRQGEFERHNESLEEIEFLKVDALERQTQLMLEKSITSEEAYEEGFSLSADGLLNPGDEYSPSMHTHELKLAIDEKTGKIFAWKIEPYFITPRLKKDYYNGVITRLANEKIELQYLYEQAYNIGLSGYFSKFLVPYKQDIATDSRFHIECNWLDSNTGKLWKLSTQIFEPSFTLTLNETTGEIECSFSPESFSENIELEESYFKGVLACIDKKNDINLCKLRLSKLDEYQQLSNKSTNNEERKSKPLLWISVLVIFLVVVFFAIYFNSNVDKKNSVVKVSSVAIVKEESRPISSNIENLEKVQPSFDCLNASSDVEHLICSNNALAIKDVELSSTYRLKLQATEDKGRFKAEQIQWLRSRNACSTVNCLLNLYERRLAELN
jgi:hypothetical protein